MLAVKLDVLSAGAVASFARDAPNCRGAIVMIGPLHRLDVSDMTLKTTTADGPRKRDAGIGKARSRDPAIGSRQIGKVCLIESVTVPIQESLSNLRRANDG